MTTEKTNDPAKKSKRSSLAGIEYVGIAGISKDCRDAVLRLIQFGDRITKVSILTSGSHHCLLLTVRGVDQVAVKSGFASGYGGEGPRTFSVVLQMLELLGAEIEEFDVGEDLIERLDNSALTRRDMQNLERANPKRPRDLYGYIDGRHADWAQDGTLLARVFPRILPLAIIDPRIVDLALDFEARPDSCLLDGYRRLEDIVRQRTSVDEHGTKLFSQAFDPKDGTLTWESADEGERAARMKLFTGTYGAHRNPRAHREKQPKGSDVYSEFLLLNHLFRLEAESVECEDRRMQVG